MIVNASLIPEMGAMGHIATIYHCSTPSKLSAHCQLLAGNKSVITNIIVLIQIAMLMLHKQDSNRFESTTN